MKTKDDIRAVHSLSRGRPSETGYSGICEAFEPHQHARYMRVATNRRSEISPTTSALSYLIGPVELTFLVYFLSSST